jgi:Asp-tRNA(Asn)/Glu-tRNA(Gln) amidotransferase A subunit family amidase
LSHDFRVSRRGLLAAPLALSVVASQAQAAATRSSDSLDTLDGLGLADLVRRKQVSPSELLESTIRRAETQNPKYNFLALKMYDYGRAEIAHGLPQGPFAGVPFLIKDLNEDIAGFPTSNGSRYFEGFVAARTSTLVERYRAAGLVIFGKTTAPEFGLSPSTEGKRFGYTRNPWDPSRSSGGSSGGASAAVAAGVVPMANASDGGGSIRIPASTCGLFGLKPSRGRVPMGPEHTEGWMGMSAVHAVTRSVRDSAALLDATHGLELGSQYSAPTPERPFLQEVGRSPKRLRVALMTRPLSGTPVDPECLDAVRSAARLCESLGHVVEEAAPAIDGRALADAFLDTVSVSVTAKLEAYAQATGRAPSPDVLETVTWYFYQRAQKTNPLALARASTTFQGAAVKLAEFMQNYDLILTPTIAQLPAKLGVLNLSPENMQDYVAAVVSYAPFGQLANETGVPAMSVPLAWSKAGLPIGIMFTARYGEEATLLRLAGQLEQARPWANRRAPIA